jgi:hypothetical protein
MYDFSLLERETKMRQWELLREAETRRLLRQARQGRRSRWSRLACWLLYHVGCTLVALGGRLQGRDRAATFPLNGHANGATLSRGE